MLRVSALRGLRRTFRPGCPYRPDCVARRCSRSRRRNADRGSHRGPEGRSLRRGPAGYSWAWYGRRRCTACSDPVRDSFPRRGAYELVGVDLLLRRAGTGGRHAVVRRKSRISPNGLTASVAVDRFLIRRTGKRRRAECGNRRRHSGPRRLPERSYTVRIRLRSCRRRPLRR